MLPDPTASDFSNPASQSMALWPLPTESLTPPIPGQRNELHVWQCGIEIKEGDKKKKSSWCRSNKERKRKENMQKHEVHVNTKRGALP